MTHEPESTTSSAPTGPCSPAARYINQEAVRSRHHMKCMSLNIAILQLAPLVHQHRQASCTPSPQSCWLPRQLTDKVMMAV